MMPIAGGGGGGGQKGVIVEFRTVKPRVLKYFLHVLQPISLLLEPSWDQRIVSLILMN